MGLIIDVILGGWQFIIGVILGAIASWLVTHIYYRKGSREQRNLFNKLTEDVREAILQNPSEVLRDVELLKVLEKLKTDPIDTERLTGTIDGGTF